VYSHLPFPTFLTSCLAVLAPRIQFRFSLVELTNGCSSGGNSQGLPPRSIRLSPASLGYPHQFSIKTLLLKRKRERNSKKNKERERERTRCEVNRERKGARMRDTERTRGMGAGGVCDVKVKENGRHICCVDQTPLSIYKINFVCDYLPHPSLALFTALIIHLHATISLWSFTSFTRVEKNEVSYFSSRFPSTIKFQISRNRSPSQLHQFNILSLSRYRLVCVVFVVIETYIYVEEMLIYVKEPYTYIGKRDVHIYKRGRRVFQWGLDVCKRKL